MSRSREQGRKAGGMIARESARARSDLMLHAQHCVVFKFFNARLNVEIDIHLLIKDARNK